MEMASESLDQSICSKAEVMPELKLLSRDIFLPSTFRNYIVCDLPCVP